MSTTVELAEIEVSEVEDAVGSRSFDRGRAYARQGRVLNLEWDAAGEALSGTVIGQGALYTTTVWFDTDSDGGLAFRDGECTCPVGYNCKHVAAIMIVASGGHAPGRPARRTRSPRRAAPVAKGRSWEEPLRALIETPVVQAAGTALAIELTLQWTGLAGGGAPRLLARLMRPGARGGWVNGSLNWNGLDSWHVKDGNYRPDHLQLAGELYALHRARQGRDSYYYSYGAERTLDLTDCGEQLWGWLDQAARRGLSLLHARGELGELPRYQRGEVAIDVTRQSDKSSLARAVVDLDGEPGSHLEPVLFLGSDGHGLMCTNQDPGPDASHWRLHLVRLARPAPPQLQSMLLDGESVAVPAADLERFAHEICPALRRVAAVVSSDGSFTPPEVSEPSLVLRARYGEGHTVELAWEWAYQIGAETRREPLAVNGGGPGFRDLDREHAILLDSALPGTGLEHLGLLDQAGRPAPAPPVWLTGLDSLHLATEVLPRVVARDGLTVEIDGSPPDYRDVSDSLTIGVSTADIAGERDWFDLGVTISVEGREVGFADVFVALASGQSQMLLDDGAHFSLLEPRLQSLRQLIEEARELTDPSAPLRISRYQAGLWSELVALGVVTEQAQAWQRQVEALLGLDSLAAHEPPAGLAAQLRPYQREGFEWLAALWELELGGILADDMGLGKTLQALALICHARARDAGSGPFLVVAPTSVVPGWVAEAARFAAELRLEAVTDTLAKSNRPVAALAGADVVVTTYTLLRLEAEAYGQIQWAGVILDEAQYVKNHQAKTYRCVRELAAPFKLALTGTPMENNLMELWSLLSITAPGLFPEPKRFAQQYQRPIERGADPERLARLRRRIKPLVKRRSKELVAAELPAKQEQLLEVALHPRHRKLYDTRLQRERQKILGLLGDFDRNRFTILRSITLLRQLSLHPGLIDERHGDVPCAKLGALSEHLAEVIEGGHRALVFSQFTGFLARVRQRLDRDGIGYCYLDGRTRRRDRVIEAFKTGSDPVFLISLKAGGFGLNLTEADYCFLLDPWWNPATEAQAVDRTHRIGQTRNVMVYRLIASGTIEEKVMALKARKAELFSSVIDSDGAFSSALSADDIRALFA